MKCLINDFVEIDPDLDYEDFEDYEDIDLDSTFFAIDMDCYLC